MLARARSAYRSRVVPCAGRWALSAGCQVFMTRLRRIMVCEVEVVAIGGLYYCGQALNGFEDRRWP